MKNSNILILSLGFTIIFLSEDGSSHANPKPVYGVPGQTPGRPLGECPPNNPEANKALIIRLYDEVLGNKNVENIDKFFAEDVLDHNPFVADGLAFRRNSITSGTLAGPPVKIEIQRIIAGEDYVWVHSRFPITSLNGVYAVVDIYRFRCGLIQEHWDVLQNTKLNMPSLNSHPFF